MCKHAQRLYIFVQVCQVTLKNGDNYTCAGIGQATWTLEQTQPYVFKVKFSGGSDGR